MMMMGNMGGGSMGGGSMGMDMMNMGGGSMGMNGQAMGQMNMGTNMGMGYQGMQQGSGLFGGGLNITSLLTGILNFAIELFVILLVIGVIVGIVVYIKRALFDGNCPVTGTFTAPKTVCTKCGTVLKSDWNCCPKCGEVKFNPVAQAQNN